MEEQTPLEISELFTSYEEDFQNTIKDLNLKYKSYTSGNSPNNNQVQVIKRQISDCENCLKQMEFELQCLPNIIKKNFNPIVNKYRHNYDEIHQKYKKLILIQSVDSQTNSNNQHKANLIRKGDQIVEQGQILENMEKMAEETENMVYTVQSRLLEDRQILKKNLQNIHEIEGELKKSNMIINILNKRIIIDRTILYLIVIVLFVLNILVLYIKL